MATIEISYEGDLRTYCAHGSSSQVIHTDAPLDHGKGEYFSPTDLLAISLGSCVLTLMGVVAKRLNIDITGTRTTVEKEIKESPRRLGKLILHIYCPKNFGEKIHTQLEKAAKVCPVHESLHPDILQEMHFHWGNL
jgi:putative redox protein